MSAEKKKKPQKNPHAGHRERMRERFFESGLDGWSEHEILEFLLFYVHSRKDTNLMGHRLIDKFGSLRGVLEADYEELLSVPEIGERGAALLTFIPKMMQVCSTGGERKVLRTFEERRNYFQSRLSAETREVTLIACMDDRHRVRVCREIARGVSNRTDVRMQELFKAVLQTKCTKVILAHNHPQGIATPSNDDIVTTRAVAKYLDSIGIELVDHIIVAENSAISMAETGSFRPPHSPGRI